MRLRSIGYEAWQNLVSGASKVVGSVLTLALLVGALACLETFAVLGVQRSIEAYVDSAANVKIVQADGTVDPRACEALSERGDVSSSGALSESDAVGLLADPGSTFSAYEVTPGFAALLQIDGDGSGAVISDRLARRTGFQIGDSLESSQGVFPLTGIFQWPEDGRDARLAHAFLVPSATLREADECWGTLDLGHGATYVRDVLSTTLVTGVDSGGGSYGQVNNAFGGDLSPSTLYAERLTRFAWLGAAAAGVLVGAATTWRRRLAWASDLHAGARRTDVLAIAGVESMGVVLAAGLVVSAACATSLAVTDSLSDLRERLIPGTIVVAWGLLGYLAGSLGATSVIRESWLFRFFKLR